MRNLGRAHVFAKRSPRIIAFGTPTEGSRDPALSASGGVLVLTNGLLAQHKERAPAGLAGAPLWPLSVASLCGGRFTPRRRQLVEIMSNRQRRSTPAFLCRPLGRIVPGWRRTTSSSNAHRQVALPATGTRTISTCLRAVKLSAASSRSMQRRSARRGCGRSPSGITRIARRPTGMRQRARLP
jgi:hypothetical protein